MRELLLRARQASAGFVAMPEHIAISGPLLVTLAASIFAGANAAATAIYRRGGTIVTTFLIRCTVVYAFNGIIVAKREGRQAAVRVLLLRTGRKHSSWMAVARSAVGAFMGVLLNLSFVFLTFADAFTIFKGTDTLATIALSRLLLGGGERLEWRELACGMCTLAGVALIAQPPSIFGASNTAAAATRVSAVGLLVALTAGVGSGAFNYLTRSLSRSGGPHEGYLPPAMLLSYFMVVVLAYVALLALASHATGLSGVVGWEWTRLSPPSDGTDSLLLLVYCAGILSGQLAMAEGYRTTRAGIAAFLALTELAFSYVLGAAALQEPTSVLSACGTAVVFCSVGLLVVGRRQPVEPLARADAQLDSATEAHSVEADHDSLTSTSPE